MGKAGGGECRNHVIVRFEKKKKNSGTMIFSNYIRCIKVNIRLSVCLLSCSSNFTGTLIFISAITSVVALATYYMSGIL